MHKRRESRITAMQFLYQLQFEELANTWRSLLDQNAQEGELHRAFSEFMNSFDEKDRSSLDQSSFTFALIKGVLQNFATLNSIIPRHTKKGNLEKIGKIELTILFMATYELLFEKDTPPKVVIDEAIEITKQFSTESAHSFVNGVLDSIAKTEEA